MARPSTTPDGPRIWGTMVAKFRGNERLLALLKDKAISHIEFPNQHRF